MRNGVQRVLLPHMPWVGVVGQKHTHTHTHEHETNLRIELGVANTHTEASSKLLRLLTYNAPTGLEELIFSMSVVMITIV